MNYCTLGRAMTHKYFPKESRLRHLTSLNQLQLNFAKDFLQNRNHFAIGVERDCIAR